MTNDQIPMMVAALRAALSKKMMARSASVIGHWLLDIGH
jgi:hypothetical protein